MNSLLQVISDQSAFAFTGRVNFLEKKNAKFMGSILLMEGYIVNASYNGLAPKKSLFNLLYLDHMSNGEYKYVVEPEVVEEGDIQLNFSLADLKRELGIYVEKYRESEKLRPGPNLKLSLISAFIVEGEDVCEKEFELMTTLSDYSSVKDVYKNCSLLDHEITMGLVSLRKKNAIKVLG